MRRALSLRPRSAMIVIGVWFMVAPCAFADHPSRYQAVTTPGGLVFQHRFDEITPYAAVNFGWSIASDTRAGEGSRAMFGSLMVNGVSPARPSDFFERLADLHATASISVGDLAVSAETKAPAKELPAALAMLVKAVRSGTPNAKTFRRTKATFSTGEVQAAARPETQVHRAAAVMLLGDHPQTRAFDPKRFETATLSDLATWRKTTFEQGPLQIVVSGRISAEAAATMLDQAFAAWPKAVATSRPKPPLIAPTVTSITVATTGKQAVIQLQAPTREIAPGLDSQTAIVAANVLGGGAASRLWQAVRGTLGASYGAGAQLASLGPEQRRLSLNASVDPATTEASIVAMRKAYATWYESGITEAELRAQRDRMITGFQSNFRDPAAANRLMLPLLLLGRPPEAIMSYESNLAGLTVEAVNAFIKARFPKPDDLMQVVGMPEGMALAAHCNVKSWQEVATACKRP